MIFNKLNVHVLKTIDIVGECELCVKCSMYFFEFTVYLCLFE